MTTAKHKVKFSAGRQAKKVEQMPSANVATTCIPRITKMVALAIRFDHLIKTGQVKDQAELARLGHVSRARLTQIMDLLLLAPVIQENLLQSADVGNIDERRIRSVVKLIDWKLQTVSWNALKSREKLTIIENTPALDCSHT